MNNEEYAYICEDGKWSAYDLSHKYDNYQPVSYIAEPVKIPSDFPKELAA